MEPSSDQRPDADLPPTDQQRVDTANDFLDICDRLSTEFESGYYWEDIQRALRIAAGLEKWPD